MMWCSNEGIKLNEGMTGSLTYTRPTSVLIQCVYKRHNVTIPLSLHGTRPSTTRMLQTRKSPRQRQSSLNMDTHFLPPAIMDIHFLFESVFSDCYEKTMLKIHRRSMFWPIKFMPVLDVPDQGALKLSCRPEMIASRWSLPIWRC